MEAKGVSSLAKRGKRAYDVLTADESRAAALDSLLVKLQAAQERREVSVFCFFGCNALSEMHHELS
jgi:Asp/Glu/hydantoin racemase